MSQDFCKTRDDPPFKCFDFEAAGLKWLKVSKGPKIVEVKGVSDTHLLLEHINSVPLNKLAAFQFGRDLYHLHKAGADYFGCPPENYSGPLYFGPLSDLIVLPKVKPNLSWSEYYIAQRLQPFLKVALDRGNISVENVKDIEKRFSILEKIEKTVKDPFFHKPARVHGDLWSGNLMWERGVNGTNAVLIDPSAHGGCFEEDLSMLELFGIPLYDEILSGYQSVHQIESGFNDRKLVHQLSMILAHVAFFGGGYLGQSLMMIRQITEKFS